MSCVLTESYGGVTCFVWAVFKFRDFVRGFCGVEIVLAALDLYLKFPVQC